MLADVAALLRHGRKDLLRLIQTKTRLEFRSKEPKPPHGKRCSGLGAEESGRATNCPQELVQKLTEVFAPVKNLLSKLMKFARLYFLDRIADHLYTSAKSRLPFPLSVRP